MKKGVWARQVVVDWLRVGICVAAAALFQAQARGVRASTLPDGQAACRVEDAPQVLAAAHRAIGVDKTSIVSMQVKSTSQLVSATGSPMVNELSANLPNQFVHIGTSKVSGITYVRGFSGSELLYDVRGITRPTTPQHRRNEVDIQRHDLGVWMMGLFAQRPDGRPHRLELVGLRPHRGADAIQIKVVDSPSLVREFWLDPTTCLPKAVRYERYAHLMDDQDPGASSPGLVRMEDVWFDHRQTSGLLLPQRLERYTTDRLTMKLSIEQVQINPKLDPNLFRASGR